MVVRAAAAVRIEARKARHEEPTYAIPRALATLQSVTSQLAIRAQRQRAKYPRASNERRVSKREKRRLKRPILLCQQKSLLEKRGNRAEKQSSVRLPHGSSMRVQSSVLIASIAVLAGPSCADDFSPDPTEPLESRASAGGVLLDASTSPISDAYVRRHVDAGAPQARSPCELAGHYLITERLAADYLGVRQVAYNWFYAELQQRGTQLEFVQSTSCGGTVKGRPLVNVSLDDESAWPAYLNDAAYDGRKGSVAAVAGGCSVRIDQDVIVHGASASAYQDLDVPLPTLDQPASPGSVGWEDADGDGHPGVTLRLHGDAQGELYTVTRTWTQYEGTIPGGVESFTLGLDWGQSRSTLGPSGFAFTFDAVRTPDASPQLVELTLLMDDEWAGDDATRCARLRELAPTLTPHAMQ